MSPTSPDTDRAPGLIRNVLLIGGTALLAIFATGIATGASVAAYESGLTATRAAIIAGAFAITGLSAWAGWRFSRASGPLSPRTRKARNLVWACGGVGAVLGLLLAFSEDGMPKASLFSDEAISPTIAVLMLAVWFIALPLITWRWKATVDEHELGAYTFGGMAALYAYTFLTPGWWIAWRAGFVPEPQHMMIFLLTMCVWGGGQLWRKYR